jgi:hypothetical protein
MNVEQLIQNVRSNKSLSKDEILAIRNDQQLRADLVNLFQTNPDRRITLALLNEFIELRKDPDSIIYIEELMLASFLVGMHGHVEDCLKVWEAKNADFDAYCGLDGELILFSGIDETISFLKSQTSDEAQKALEYVTGFDAEEVSEYFSKTPWWV